MKRKTLLLILGLSVIVVLSSAAAVMADKGGDPHSPHNGGCVAYCARAVLHVGTKVNGEWEWAPLNPDGGKIKNCFKESAALLGVSCLRSGSCPEILDDPEFPDGRCPMTAEDGFGPNPDEHPIICKVVRGPEGHPH